MMNANIPFVQNAPEARPFVTPTRVAERDAWVRAARGRNHRMLTYRKWAREDYAAGNIGKAMQWAKEARKQRMSALNALSWARLEATYCNDHN